MANIESKATVDSATYNMVDVGPLLVDSGWGDKTQGTWMDTNVPAPYANGDQECYIDLMVGTITPT